MNEKELINKENEKPDPGFNSDLIPDFLNSEFSKEGNFLPDCTVSEQGVGVV